MKKCPPGVICIENITVLIFIIIFGIIGYLAHLGMRGTTTNIHDKIIIKEAPSGTIRQIPSYPYNNLPEDVLLNPYVPPLKDERYFIPELTRRPPGTIPINISTNIGAVDTTYRQLGLLTPLNGVNKDNLLPLMGRPLFTNRQKYQYYSISNQHNNIKLPVFVKGRSGTAEYGVDQLFNGDTVYVEGYNEAFKVRAYDTDTIKYLPFL